jgi:hypothetical protein
MLMGAQVERILPLLLELTCRVLDIAADPTSIALSGEMSEGKIVSAIRHGTAVLFGVNDANGKPIIFIG